MLQTLITVVQTRMIHIHVEITGSGADLVDMVAIMTTGLYNVTYAPPPVVEILLIPGLVFAELLALYSQKLIHYRFVFCFRIFSRKWPIIH